MDILKCSKFIKGMKSPIMFINTMTQTVTGRLVRKYVCLIRIVFRSTWASTAFLCATILPVPHSGCYSAVTLAGWNDASKGGQGAFLPKPGSLQGKRCIRLAEAILLLGAGNRGHLPLHLLVFGRLYQP